jgi:hypothetical protein
MTSTENTPAWKTRLQPFAETYARLVRDIEVVARECDDDELATLAHQATEPTPVNCWWATYEVAQLVADRVRADSFRRARARASS